MPFKIKISNAAGDSAWRTVANAHIKTSSSVWNRVRAGWIKISNAAGDAGWRRFFVEVSLPVQTTPPTIRVTNTSGIGTIYDGAIASSPRFLDQDLFGKDGVYTNYTSISGRRFSKAVDLDTSIRTTVVNDDRFTSAGGVTVADRLAIDDNYLFYEVVVSNGGDNVINPVSSPILMIKRQPAVDTVFTVSLNGNPAPNQTLTFNYHLQNYYYNRIEQGNSKIRWWRSNDNTASGTLLKEEVLTNTVTFSDSTLLQGTSTYTIANSADNGFYIVAEVVGVSSWTRNNSLPNGIQVVSSFVGPVQPAYRFSFGKTLYVSSNGYIGLDAGSIGATVMGAGRNIAILARDLQQWYLAEYSDTNFYYLYFRSYLYGETNSSLNAVDYQIKFYNDPLIDYCDVYMVRVGSNVTTPSIQRGYYGSGNTQYAGTDGASFFIGTGSTVRIYFGGTPMKTTGVSWTTINDNIWDVIQTWPYPNTLDDSFTAVVSAANQQAQALTAPTISSVTTGNIGGPVSVNFTGGSGPFYQAFWYTGISAPTGQVTPDASGSSSPLTDSTGPTSTTTQYMYVRSVQTAGELSLGPTTLASSWSAGFAFNMTNPVPSGGTVSISTNTGNYNVGSIITYSTTGWANSPTSYSLRLYNGTNPVLTSDPLRASTTSTSGTYTIASGDVGKFFKAFATATNSGGTSTEASSTQVGPATVAPIIPTITMGSNTLVTSSSGRINWTSTNQASFSSNGTFAGTGTTATFVAATGLAASTTYTGTVIVTSSTGNTASANYSLTTSAAAPQYTVTWAANGGSGGGTTGPFVSGTSHTAPSPGTRSGFTFSNWRHPASGDLLYTVNDGGTFNPTSNLTFTAIWTAVQLTPTVSTITASTTGRSGSSPNFVFANPKATFNFTFTNTTSCTIHIDNSSDGITWTSGVANNLSVTNNAITLSTNLPSGTTTASGNFYYRARVNAWSGASQSGNSTGLKTSETIRNTQTAISNRSLTFA
jgi:hypothetical protein